MSNASSGETRSRPLRSNKEQHVTQAQVQPAPKVIQPAFAQNFLDLAEADKSFEFQETAPGKRIKIHLTPPQE